MKTGHHGVVVVGSLPDTVVYSVSALTASGKDVPVAAIRVTKRSFRFHKRN